MTRQNRVLPTGEIVAYPGRGDMMGNRGCLHDAAGRLGQRRWMHRNWVACRLDFRGRRRRLMAPGRYTELFFLDEATALAAGHRPCGECRREDYLKFKRLWASPHGDDSPAAMDLRLHRNRVRRARSQVRHEAEAGALPDGAFILADGAAWLVTGGRLLRHGCAGYDALRPRPRGPVTVLTPRATVAVIGLPPGAARERRGLRRRAPGRTLCPMILRTSPEGTAP